MDGTSTTETTVADAFLKAMAVRGIKYVFANGGTDFAPVIEGLAKSGETGLATPQFMSVPHENVAVSMATGYYEISGEMAAVMVHVTVGTANTLCGLMNAAREDLPLMLIAGRTPVTEYGHAASRDGNIHWGQESFDQGGMVREWVKWDYELHAGQPVDSVVGRAMDIAMSAPPGPVYLTLPREVLAGPAGDTGPGPRPRPVGTMAAMPSGEAIEQAADMIANAERVLIVTGASRRAPGAFEALAGLAEDYAIGVIQPTGINIPASHPMNLGMPSTNKLEWADLIVVIDAPVPWIPINAMPGKDTKFIHMGSDPLFERFPYRGYEMDLAVSGHTSAALPMLHDALATKKKNMVKKIDNRRAELDDIVQDIRGRRAKRVEEVRNMSPIHPVWTTHCLNQVKDDDAILMNEIGMPLDHIQIDQPNCFMGGSGAGGLGRALGAALGAKLAAPERQVIAAMGDGSYMFGNPTSAHFVARAQNLPTLTMVANNAQWFAVRGAALSVYPDGYASRANVPPVSDLSPSPDFEKGMAATGG
ncbi:MAG: thiamine pyrophosphate-requiring protein, partial [Rhodospirillales bacterium]|nr:thiamine pyrophosphate-requiring protein [Rhodospirillales bacterium]